MRRMEGEKSERREGEKIEEERKDMFQREKWGEEEESKKVDARCTYIQVSSITINSTFQDGVHDMQ